MRVAKVTGATLGILSIIALPLLAWPGQATAQSYPTKPIRWIIPYNPGGGTDSSARILQIAIEQNKLLPQPLAAVNVGGAGGSIGARQVKDAPPDGYTILIHQSALLIQEAAGISDFGFRNFEPIVSINVQCMVAGVLDGGPFTSYRQLMDEAKAKPKTIVWGGNIGSANHMAIAAMEKGTPGAEFKKVQIGGAAESYAGIKGKVTQVGNFGVGEIVAYRGGGLKPLAILAEARDPAIADVPTAKELGYDAVFCNEHNLYAPKGTPPDRVALLTEAFRKALSLESVKKEYAEKLGAKINLRSGAELVTHIAAELERFKPMAKEMKPN